MSIRCGCCTLQAWQGRVKQRSEVGFGVRPVYRALELQRTDLVLLRDLLGRLEQLKVTSEHTQRELPGERAWQKSFGAVKRQLDFSSLLTRSAVAPSLRPGLDRAGVPGVGIS